MKKQIFAKITGGNIKLGNMGSFSKLYGDMVHDTPYGKIHGTCSGHCDGCRHACYVRKSYRYGSVIKCHARNTLAFRVDIDNAFMDLDKQLSRKRKPFEIVRINQSGEIESTLELMYWCELAKRHPETQFYIYTKNYLALTECIAMHSDPYEVFTIPDNFTILISIWHDQGVKYFEYFKRYSFIKCFVYDDGYINPAIKVQTYCKAYDNTGKLDHNITCDKCKKCFNRSDNFKAIGCKAH